MNYRFLPLLFILFMSFAPKATNNAKPKFLAVKKEVSLLSKIEMVYTELELNNSSLPKMDCFKKALTGYYNLKQKGQIQKDILTVIDFSISSTQKRMWVINLKDNTVLFHSYVAHGMKSGLEFASQFSNAQSSNKSSLGFYTTGETYMGKHGLSLKLDGQERGINHNARARAVVMHGADYASPSVLKSQHYLGRSQGCPAIPEKIKKQVIQAIKGKSCLFIYHPTRSYDIASKLVA